MAITEFIKKEQIKGNTIDQGKATYLYLALFIHEADSKCLAKKNRHT